MKKNDYKEVNTSTDFTQHFIRQKSRKLIVIRHLGFNKLQVDKNSVNASRSQVYKNAC